MLPVHVNGGVIWAYIVGGACSILSIGDPIEKQCEANTELLE